MATISCAVERYHPIWECSGDNLSPTGPQGRNRGTFVSVTAKSETSVIPTTASAEWRNPPRGIRNNHKIKIATWEDSSTPLGMTCRGVVPFNQTGYIRYGASPWRGWMAMNHRRYIVPYIRRYHSPAQVIYGTWRAADCRPYNTFVSLYRIFDVFITILRFNNGKNDVH